MENKSFLDIVETCLWENGGDHLSCGPQHSKGETVAAAEQGGDPGQALSRWAVGWGTVSPACPGLAGTAEPGKARGPRTGLGGQASPKPPPRPLGMARILSFGKGLERA